MIILKKCTKRKSRVCLGVQCMSPCSYISHHTKCKRQWVRRSDIPSPAKIVNRRYQTLPCRQCSSWWQTFCVPLAMAFNSHRLEKTQMPFVIFTIRPMISFSPWERSTHFSLCFAMIMDCCPIMLKVSMQAARLNLSSGSLSTFAAYRLYCGECTREHNKLLSDSAQRIHHSNNKAEN